MARIVSKLNLNKTPGLVDNNSMVFARNIKLLEDGSISRDDGIYKFELDLDSVLDTLAVQIENLESTVDDYTDTIADLQEELFNNTPKGVIFNYFQDILNDNPSSLNFPEIDDFAGSDLVDYYSINDGDGTYELPYTKSDYVNSSAALRSFINASSLKIPVFPDYFYNFVQIENGETGTKFQEIAGFTYSEWRTAVNQLSVDTNRATFFNNVFTKVQDYGNNHIREQDEYNDWVHEYYALVTYFNWFLHNHGNNIAGLIKSLDSALSANIQNQILYYTDAINKLTAKIEGLNNLYDAIEGDNYKIVGVIPYNTMFFLFCTALYDGTSTNGFILKYDEKEDTFEFCNVDWNWSGGTITGNVNINLKGQIILNVAEYKNDLTLIPFKSINLDIATYDLDESVYTQTPIIPLTNLTFINTYSKQIPNGTYQFFIRYRIADDIYTKWTPASTVLFAGNSFTKSTVAGKIKYCDTSIDANKSFVFSFDHVNNEAIQTYRDFQIGFILTHDNETVARAWKHFSFDTDLIYFDYEKSFIEEIPIEDLLEVKYNIYNVKNVTSFKNKLYIANYKESDFNPDFVNLAKSVAVQLQNISSASVEDRSTYSYVQNNQEKTKNIHVEINDNSGISYFDYIKNYDDNGNDKYVDINDDGLEHTSILTDIWNKTEVRNFFTNNNLAENDTCTVTVFGITGTFKVSHVENNSIVSAGYSGYYGGSSLSGEELDTYDKLKSFIKGLMPYACIDTGNIVKDIWITRGVLDTIIHYTGSKRIDIDVTYTFNKNSVRLYKSNAASRTTLIPGQFYKFFIHYVKPTGEITNGYIINNGLELEVPINTSLSEAISNHNIFYPKFTNIVYPEGYNACFISIAKTRNLTAEVFKVRRKTFGSSNVYTGHSLELDTRLISLVENIPVKLLYNNTVVDTNANKYHPSYDGDGRFMGCSGNVELVLESNTNLKSAFINIFEVNNEDKLELIKCTPFIFNVSEYDSFDKMNLLGYICNVLKLTGYRNQDKDYFDYNYISGNDIYSKNYTNEGLQLVKNESVVHSSDANAEYTVYSNYNLSYLSLNIDLRDVVRSTGSGSQTSTIITILQSLEASDVFKLEPMYRDFVQKSYNPYSNESIVKFDNTIRSSNVLGDESANGAYEFNSTDYYNVPTNKGKIVNLCALGNFIIVHTEDSMFKFTGNNTISSNGGEDIALKESDVFDTGVSEVFGSDYGFGGLKDKNHVIVLPEIYVFFDADAKEIYAYSGQGQINRISEPIKKLINSANIRSFNLAGDYFNNRIMFCIEFEDIRHLTYITLSYNIKTNSFISLHNFKFDKSFNTKNKCYFINYVTNNVYRIDNSIIGYNDLSERDKSYPSYIFNNYDSQGHIIDSRLGSIVDIIVANNLEVIKSLNAISWIVSKVVDFRYRGFANVKQIFMAEEQLDRDYAGDKIRIYTDTCSTSVLDITERSNDYSVNDAKSFMLPRYNQGVWTFNYFRDIVNIDDIGDYMSTSDKNKDKQNAGNAYPQFIPNNENFSDNHSLIEGKYFIIRFIFDPMNNFKLENVSVNYNNKANYEQ